MAQDPAPAQVPQAQPAPQISQQAQPPVAHRARPEHPKYQPKVLARLGPSILLDYHYFRILYCAQRKVPLAVYQSLLRAKGSVSRKGMEFYEQSGLPQHARSKLSDYQYFAGLIGTNRGHMAAAGNYSWSQQAMRASFTLANVLPQNQDSNGDLWNSLQDAARELLPLCDHVDVVSGPVFQASPLDKNTVRPHRRSDDQKLQKLRASAGPLGSVQYYALGQNQVAMPPSLFKLLRCSKDSKAYTAAFKVKNARSEYNQNRKPLSTYELSLQKLSASTGIDFQEFKGESLVQHLPMIFAVPRIEYDRSYFMRRLEKAKTLSDLLEIDRKAAARKVGKIDELAFALKAKLAEGFDSNLINDCAKTAEVRQLSYSLKTSRHLSDVQKPELLQVLRDSIARCPIVA